MQDSSRRRFSIVLVAIWPFATPFLLMVLAATVTNATSRLRYTTELDSSFYTHAGYTVIQNVIAFALVPMLIFVVARRQLSAKVADAMLIIGVFLVALQIFLRLLADAATHLDCGDSCVATVMPSGPTATESVIVGVALVLVYVIVLAISLKLKTRGASPPV